MARDQNDKMAAIISVHWLYGSSKHIYTPFLDFCKECTLRTQEKKEYFRAGRDSNSTPSDCHQRVREIRLNLLELIHFQ